MRQMLWKRRLTVLCVVVILVLILLSNYAERKTTGDATADVDSRDVETRKMMQKYNEETFESRINLYKQGCSILKHVSSNPINVLVNPQHGLAYCHVAKAGSTFWMRFFRFLVGDVPGQKENTNLYQIDKSYAHYAPLKGNAYVLLTGNGSTENHLKKFLVTRDPYSRLWASYLDKFFLPDFWWTHGKAVLADRRKKEKENASEPDATSKDTFCPDNISFTEFLRHSLRLNDEHWRPISQMCDPCRLKPDFIARMESFSRDRELILQKVNLSHLLTDMKAHSHEDTEVASQIYFNFGLLKRRPVHENCPTVLSLAKKLWASFQFNGYIRQDATFPEEQLNITDGPWDRELVQNVSSVFQTEMKKHPLSPYKRYQQKKEAMLAAYRQVPREILERLESKYSGDFLLFGYNATLPI